MLKTISELNVGYSDAQNYMRRANKQMFSEVFVKNDYLDRLLYPQVYYLVGEKGTGKTAYATYLTNTDYHNTKSILKFISNTDYEKFYELKKRKQIDISGYSDIWKTILLLLLAKCVMDDQRVVSMSAKSNLPSLMRAIDEYYDNAFSPEIINALKIVDNSEAFAKVLCKIAEAGGNEGRTVEVNGQQLQMNLLYISKKFTDSFEKLKLSKNVTLYIDGIDVRPNQIPYEDYLQCIKGLANACWYLNTEIFANVKDSKEQLKVVLLLRPDIFNSLNLQNATNKLVDNAVYLDWKTTYTEYRDSYLYEMANKLLAYGQTEKVQEIWEQYFKWDIPSSNKSQRKKDTAFMEFLRISLSRPRDIQMILYLLKTIMTNRRMGNMREFDFNTFKSDRFQNDYSEYFLGALKDQLSFYYSDEDFKHFKKFFDLFKEPQFTFEQYQNAYEKYENYILDNASDVPKFVENSKTFLQLLYDCNVVTAIEDDGKYFHFSYREKSPSNIAPEVLFGKDIQYRFHFGMYKKANMGRYE